MEQIIFTKSYPEPPLNRREILRYMGCGGAGETAQGIDALLTECLSEVLPHLSYKVCWRAFPIRETKRDSLDLGFMQTESRDLYRNLRGCDRFVLFAATVGLSPDRLIAKYGRISPAKALFIQAIGAERIESLCDVFCGELEQKYAAEGFTMRPRFSPGYGDFPLEAQKAVFQTLDCPRKIGLSLNDSLLMSPSKSVTAMVGFSLGAAPEESPKKATENLSDRSKAQGEKAQGEKLKDECQEAPSRCESCDKTDCAFRKA